MANGFWVLGEFSKEIGQKPRPINKLYKLINVLALSRLAYLLSFGLYGSNISPIF